MNKPSKLNNAIRGSQEKAGAISGIVRAKRTKLRRLIVLAAHIGLKPPYRSQPYSTESINTLCDEYLNILQCKPNNLLEVACREMAKEPNCEHTWDFPLFLSTLIKLDHLPHNDRHALEKISTETLVKDLKALGVRSKRRKKRSG